MNFHNAVLTQLSLRYQGFTVKTDRRLKWLIFKKPEILQLWNVKLSITIPK